MCSLRRQLFISEAGKGPYCFAGVYFPDMLNERKQGALIGRLKGLSAEDCQTVYIARAQHFDDFFLHGAVKRLAVAKIPGFRLKTMLTVIGASGDKQRHADSDYVGYIAVFYFTVIHAPSSFLFIDVKLFP